jgi:hypothetical protein
MNRGFDWKRAMPTFNARRPWWWAIVVAVAAAVSYYININQQQPSVAPAPRSVGSGTVEDRTAQSQKPRPPGTGNPPAGSSMERLDPLPALIRARRADRDTSTATVVESGGKIVKLLPDDTEGDRHQRLLVRISTSDTILIAHNIDIASRIDASEGDSIRFKGEYIWTDRGGVVHWTHRDPRHRHPDGWVEVNGKRFD